MLAAHLSDRLETTLDPSVADYAVAITRLNAHLKLEPVCEQLHVVERGGVPLCFVYKLPNEPLP